MPENPYQPPKEAGAPQISNKRRRFLGPLTAPFAGAAVGAACGALYGIGYFLINFLGVLEPRTFIIETLEAVIGFGSYCGIIGGGIGLVLAPVLWILQLRNRRP
jgi:hypothetical protein